MLPPFSFGFSKQNTDNWFIQNSIFNTSKKKCLLAVFIVHQNPLGLYRQLGSQQRCSMGIMFHLLTQSSNYTVEPTGLRLPQTCYHAEFLEDSMQRKKLLSPYFIYGYRLAVGRMTLWGSRGSREGVVSWPSWLGVVCQCMNTLSLVFVEGGRWFSVSSGEKGGRSPWLHTGEQYVGYVSTKGSFVRGCSKL